MEAQIAALCDSAMDYNGKLSLLGAFDTILAPDVPAVHPQCSVALRLLFRKEEEGRHALRVNFVDEDGKSIIPPMEAMMEVSLPDAFFFTTHNVVLNLQQIRFEKAGIYSVDIALDGRQIASVPLQIMRIQRPER
jgi:hypothetical protein